MPSDPSFITREITTATGTLYRSFFSGGVKGVTKGLKYGGGIGAGVGALMGGITGGPAGALGGVLTGGLTGSIAGMGLGTIFGPLIKASSKLTESWTRLLTVTRSLIGVYKEYHPTIAKLNVEWKILDRRVNAAWAKTIAPTLKRISDVGKEFQERWTRIKINVFQSMEWLFKALFKALEKLTSFLLSFIEMLIKLINLIKTLVKQALLPMIMVVKLVSGAIKGIAEWLGYIKPKAPKAISIPTPMSGDWNEKRGAGKFFPIPVRPTWRTSSVGAPASKLTEKLQFGIGKWLDNLQTKLLNMIPDASYYTEKLDAIFQSFMDILAKISAGIGKLFTELWNSINEKIGLPAITPPVPTSGSIVASPESIATAKVTTISFIRSGIDATRPSLTKQVLKIVTPTGYSMYKNLKSIYNTGRSLTSFFKDTPKVPEVSEVPPIPISPIPTIPRPTSPAVKVPPISTEPITSNIPFGGMGKPSAIATAFAPLLTATSDERQKARQEDIRTYKAIIAGSKECITEAKKWTEEDVISYGGGRTREEYIKKHEETIRSYEAQIEASKKYMAKRKEKPSDATAQAPEVMPMQKTSDKQVIQTPQDTPYTESSLDEQKAVNINVLDSQQILDILEGSWDEIKWVLRQQQAEYDLTRYKLRTVGTFV